MLAVVIPAYNEEQTIARTISSVGGLKPVREVIVVDDGSSDDTWGEARKAGATVLRLPVNCGKGHALNCGYRATKAPYLAFLDADVGRTAGEINKLWEQVEAGILDMAVGDLTSAGGKGGFGLVKGMAGWGIYRLAGCRFRAPLSGQRVLVSGIMKLLDPLAGGFGAEVDLTVRALWHGFRVGEVPLDMEHRRTGRDWAGFSHRGRQLWHVGQTLASDLLAAGRLRWLG